jgi:hypothetical protein
VIAIYSSFSWVTIEISCADAFVKGIIKKRDKRGLKIFISLLIIILKAKVVNLFETNADLRKKDKLIVTDKFFVIPHIFEKKSFILRGFERFNPHIIPHITLT